MAFKEELDKKRKNQNQYVYHRLHDIITIHGARGAGKTTFLLTAIQLLTDNEALDESFQLIDPAAHDSTLKKTIKESSICGLSILDPTLLSEKEYLLTNILSRISQSVKWHHKACCSSERNDKKLQFENWQKDFNSLAEGLKFLGEFGNSTDDFSDDAQWIFDEKVMCMEREYDKKWSPTSCSIYPCGLCCNFSVAFILFIEQFCKQGKMKQLKRKRLKTKIDKVTARLLDIFMVSGGKLGYTSPNRSLSGFPIP